jgi:7,8-dihydropterin-6-yl-methyl-4-(beta-D-ribofuranosyl)aminobenzene 5'-phosphate synthase
MHLANSSEARLRKTAEALERYAVGVFAPCHCTGEMAVDFLSRRHPGTVVRVSSGSTVEI